MLTYSWYIYGRNLFSFLPSFFLVYLFIITGTVTNYSIHSFTTCIPFEPELFGKIYAHFEARRSFFTSLHDF